MNTYSAPTKKGFTLLEILLVIAAIGILAAIVLVALNPNRQLAQARNAQRRSDVSAISSAVYQKIIDDAASGSTAMNDTLVDGTVYAIGTAGSETVPTSTVCLTNTGGSSTTMIDLAPQLVGTNGTYLGAIPADPNGGNSVCTEYTITQGTNQRITVAAPGAENSVVISVTR
jgi:prepilin-type N-terminal cleavage/methylation domain-containing protein